MRLNILLYLISYLKSLAQFFLYLQQHQTYYVALKSLGILCFVFIRRKTDKKNYLKKIVHDFASVFLFIIV